MKSNKKTVKKITYLAILTALAIGIHVAESLLPIPIPVPGVKLGFANIITLFFLFHKPGSMSAADAFTILVIRITAGLLITGRFMAFAYSLTGGIFAFLAILLSKRFVTKKQIWVAGVLGAIFHNIGQILAAMILTGTPWIIVYLPILLIAAIITGTLTGVITQMVLLRLENHKLSENI